MVNYDLLASSYGRRYERHQYEGVRETLHRFADGQQKNVVLEVGCGTGHWIADLLRSGFERVVGLDLSMGMLQEARASNPGARLIHGVARHLPCADRSVDRVFCVNALHHFLDQRTFMTECRRVLRPGGGLLTVGLDPHQGQDQWWVYDYFPTALTADRLRYLATSKIRELMSAAGFHDPVTEVAQAIAAEIPFPQALQQGLVDRRSTSQLIVIGEANYEAGLARMRAEQPVLRSNLRLFATTAWVRPRRAAAAIPGPDDDLG